MPVRSATPQPSLVNPGGEQAAQILQQQNALRSEEGMNRERVAGSIQTAQIGANAQTQAASIGAGADVARAGIQAGTDRQQMAMERDAQIRQLEAEKLQQDADQRFTLRSQQDTQNFQMDMENSRQAYEKGVVEDRRAYNKTIQKQIMERQDKYQLQATKMLFGIANMMMASEDKRMDAIKAVRQTTEEASLWNKQLDQLRSNVQNYYQNGGWDEDIKKANELTSTLIATESGEYETQNSNTDHFYQNLFDKAGVRTVTPALMADSRKLGSAIEQGQVSRNDLINALTIVKEANGILESKGFSEKETSAGRYKKVLDRGTDMEMGFNFLSAKSTPKTAFQMWGEVEKIVSGKQVGNKALELIGQNGLDVKAINSLLSDMLKTNGWGVDQSDKDLSLILENTR